jgi:hypothetical protein
VERFLREAESASAIGHPNIIEIYDVGMEQDGTAFIVMELLDGVSLDVILKEKGALPPSRAVAVVLQILSALHAAHRKGIIHRDLKPENVFMAVDSRNREEVKLLDFGVAKVQEATEDSLRLTKTGTVLGTPSYLSPEQARGRKDIDERIDIWAAGVMLYQMLAGELPFKGESYNEVLANVLIEDPMPLGQLAPGAPDGLVAVVNRAMTKDRDERFKRVSDMIESLLPFCERAEYEMTPQAFEMLRKSVPPPPALPKVDTGIGMPAIPPPSPVPDVGEIGDREEEAAGERPEPEPGAGNEEVTLYEAVAPEAAGDSVGDSVRKTIRRVAENPGLKRLQQGARAAFGALSALTPATGATALAERVQKKTVKLRFLPPRQAALAALVGAGLAAVAIGLASIPSGRQPRVEVTSLAPEPVPAEPATEKAPAELSPAGSGGAAEQAASSVPAAAEPAAGSAASGPAAYGPSGEPAAGPGPSGPAGEPAAETASSVPGAESAAEPASPGTEMPPGVEPPSTVLIELRGAPAAAVVTLNGVRVKMPLVAARSEKAKTLRVTATGYQPFRRVVTLDRDQIITVHMVKAAVAGTHKTVHGPSKATKPGEKKSEKILLSNPFK